MMAQKGLKMPNSLFTPLRDTPVLNYLPLDFLCVCVGGGNLSTYLSRLVLVGLCCLYLKIFLPSLDLQNLSELGVLFYSLVYSQGLAEAYKIFLE